MFELLVYAFIFFSPLAPRGQQESGPHKHLAIPCENMFIAIHSGITPHPTPFYHLTPSTHLNNVRPSKNENPAAIVALARTIAVPATKPNR